MALGNKNRRPLAEQLQRLATITNPQQRQGLMAAIESGEEIPEHAWTPLPPHVNCDAIFRDVRERVAGCPERDNEAAPCSGRERRDANAVQDEHRDLAYGRSLYEGELVILPRKEAVRIAAMYRAAATARTWGEFKVMAPPGVYEQIGEVLEENEETLPEDDEPFDHNHIPGCADGDWPPWPQQEMLRWIPRDIQVAFGTRGFSAVSGECLTLDAARTEEIVRALEARGFRCTEENDLIARCGWRYYEPSEEEESFRTAEE